MNVFTANNPPEAHIICELLKSHGIRCEVRGEGIFGLQGEVPFGENSAPYVWLLDRDKENAANEVIQQFYSPIQGHPWTCHKCGEINEPQFAVCWQCGSASH